MNLKSMLVAGTATVAGLAGGVAVYQLTAPADMEPEAAAPAAAATPKARAANGETRFAPCRPPSVLEGGKCVTTQVQTVTAAGTGSGSAGGTGCRPGPRGACSPQGSGPRAGGSEGTCRGSRGAGTGTGGPRPPARQPPRGRE